MQTTIFRNLSLVVLSIALALVLGEFAARIVFRDITTTTDNRSYFALRWKNANVILNSFGHREQDIDPVKPAGTYRIAFVGDSFTFGQGIAEADRMSNIVGRALLERTENVEVLNFGNPGNNTSDEVRLLQTTVLGFAPDFVLLQWFVNDVENNGPQVGAREMVQPEPSRLNRFKQLLRNRSVIYFLAAEAWHRVLETLGNSYASWMSERFEDPLSPDWLAAEQSLVQFVRTCESSGVQVGIMLVPMLVPIVTNEYPFAFMHERVLAICAREGLPCVDLLEIFEDHLADKSDYMRLWVNRFDSHMGPEANRLAAAHLLEFYGPTWAIGAEVASHVTSELADPRGGQ